MSYFLARPLTSLFVLAYVIAMAAWLAVSPDRDWPGLLLVAGIYIVGAAAALSMRQRLTRAAILIEGAAAANLFVFAWSGVRGEAIAIILAIVVASFFGAAIMRRIVGFGVAHDKSGRLPAWQFSILELLGWMVVVAIVSATLRFADLGSLAYSHERPLWIHGAIAGMLAGLYLTPERRCDRVATIAAAALIIIGITVVPRVVQDWYAVQGYLPFLYAVVGLWVLVLRLDGSAAAAADMQGSTALPLRKLSSQHSHD